MEILEFLQRTDTRNFRNIVKFKVCQKINDFEIGLKERQGRLRDILAQENMQQNEEILRLVNEKLAGCRQQRIEWINTKLLAKEQARQEFLKLKKQQRDLENCEEWRHLQTHQLLVATKTAQLYQMEEKKSRLLRGQHIEQNWLKAMGQLHQEREFQHAYEVKLRKTIEDSNKQKNLEMCNQKKKHQKLVNDCQTRGCQEDNIRTLALAQKSKADEKLLEICKKMQQDLLLKSQIKISHRRDVMDKQQQLQDDNMFKEREDVKIQKELDATERSKVSNQEWHKLYLEHCTQEKQQRLKELKEHDTMYLNTGCVLQQSQKEPYRRYCQ